MDDFVVFTTIGLKNPVDCLDIQLNNLDIGTEIWLPEQKLDIKRGTGR